jgi:hypothetical protein
MLDYGTLNCAPLGDAHRITEHIVSPKGSEAQTSLNSSKAEWTGRRKAKATRFLLPRTVRWMETLPPDFQPRQTCETFPRIANAIAALWTAPEGLTEYLDDLLVDKRGQRQGFPVRVLSELHALSAYNATFLRPSERRLGIDDRQSRR